MLDTSTPPIDIEYNIDEEPEFEKPSSSEYIDKKVEGEKTEIEMSEKEPEKSESESESESKPHELIPGYIPEVIPKHIYESEYKDRGDEIKEDSPQRPPSLPSLMHRYEELADGIMLGNFGNKPLRSQNLRLRGYTDDEIQRAQGIVNNRLGLNRSNTTEDLSVIYEATESIPEVPYIPVPTDEVPSYMLEPSEMDGNNDSKEGSSQPTADTPIERSSIMWEGINDGDRAEITQIRELPSSGGGSTRVSISLRVLEDGSRSRDVKEHYIRGEQTPRTALRLARDNNNNLLDRINVGDILIFSRPNEGEGRPDWMLLDGTSIQELSTRRD